MGDSCNSVAENSAKLSPTVVWKPRCLSDNLVIYIAKEISKDVVEDDTWFLFNAYSKMGKETGK